jgi:SAM-dependent methyltransferase
MTLDVGPGHNIQPHKGQPVIRLDHRLVVRPHVAADVRVLPFKDKVFETVYASHVLEHFHYRETDAILREWLRVLRPGGEFQLFVPNLEWCLLQLVNGVEDYENVQHSLYGRQEYPSDVHRTGFTPGILAMRLAPLPLEGVEIRTFRNNLCVWARRRRDA